MHVGPVVPDPACELRFATDKLCLASVLSDAGVSIVLSARVAAAVAGDVTSAEQLVHGAKSALLADHPKFASAVRDDGLAVKPALFADAGQGVVQGVVHIAPAAADTVYRVTVCRTGRRVSAGRICYRAAVPAVRLRA